MSDNFYNILGLTEKATKDEIKKAYRTLQMKWHPDKNPGNNEATHMCKKINEAYEILGDDKKREEYDMLKNNTNPFMRMNSHNAREVPLDDIFNMFFGGQGSPFGMDGFHGMPGMEGGPKIHMFHGGPIPFQQTISKPTPILKTINISLEQVLTGANIPLEIERWIIENGCKVFENETIYVTVPQGIDENEIIILRDKGNILNEQIKGDIKIFIKIINNTEFKRIGLDLILEKKITLKEALCGFSFEIKYLNGKNYTLNNNKGNIIPSNYKKMYPNMGLQRGEHKGILIIHFEVNFPEKLSDEQINKIFEIL